MHSQSKIAKQEKLTEAGWKAFLEQMHIDQKNPLEHFVVNAEEAPEVCLRGAIEYIKQSFHRVPQKADALRSSL